MTQTPNYRLTFIDLARGSGGYQVHNPSFD